MKRARLREPDEPCDLSHGSIRQRQVQAHRQLAPRVVEQGDLVAVRPSLARPRCR